MIKIGSTYSDYQKICWVARALSTDKLRGILNYLCVKDNIIMAVDGHRLHVAHLVMDIANGIYEFMKIKKEIILSPVDMDIDGYPNIWKVVPADMTGWKKISTLGDQSQVYTSLVRAMRPDSTLVFEYFKSAVEIDLMMSILVHPEQNTPVVFQGNEVFAIVMPLRIRD